MSNEPTEIELTAKEYIDSRINDQINWYGNKSGQMKKSYLYHKNLEIWIASSIPVTVSLSATEGMSYKFFENTTTASNSFLEVLSIGLLLQILAALSGIFIVVIAKKVELNEYYRLWKEYRLTADSLTREKIYFMTKTAEYDCEPAERFKLFVDRCEAIMNEEQGKWRVMNVVSNTTQTDKKAEKADDEPTEA